MTHVQLQYKQTMQYCRRRVSLLQTNHTSTFLQLLVAPEHVALHDHTYCSHSTCGLQLSNESELSQENNLSEIQDILDSVSVSVFQKESLMVTLDEREDIEVATREQSQSQLWYLVHTRRITGSTCGKILCQHDNYDNSFAKICFIFQTI